MATFPTTRKKGLIMWEQNILFIDVRVSLVTSQASYSDHMTRLYLEIASCSYVPFQE